MARPLGSDGIPLRTALAVAAVGATLVAGCVALSPSQGPTGPTASPPFSPYVDPDPSPPFSPVIDPDPSPWPPATPGPAEYTPPWAPGGTTTSARYEAAAVALADGRVLVVGDPADREEPGAPTAELWDPATDIWSTTTGLERGRSWFAMVALRDGRALVIGGNNGDWGSATTQSYSSTYAFDPDQERWTKVGGLAQARTAPVATVLADGRVLVAGGYFHTGADETAAAPPAAPAADAPTLVLAAFRPATTTGPLPPRPPLDDVDIPPYGYALATAEIFDPSTGEWSATGPMRYARVGAEMVTLADGRVLVVGSSTSYSVTGLHPDAYDTAEVYDPATGRFTLAGSLPPIDRAAIAALGVTLPDDQGGPDGYGTGVVVGTLVAEPDGSAVLVGHEDWWRHSGEVLRSFRFDPASRTWTGIDRPCASAWPPGHPDGGWMVVEGGCRTRELRVGLADGRVLAMGGIWMSETGGEQSYEETRDARILDPATVAWTALPPMPMARSGGVVVALADGSALVFGGIVDGEYGREAIRLER
jgi:hypothetical protein